MSRHRHPQKLLDEDAAQQQADRDARAAAAEADAASAAEAAARGTAAADAAGVAEAEAAAAAPPPAAKQPAKGLTSYSRQGRQQALLATIQVLPCRPGTVLFLLVRQVLCTRIIAGSPPAASLR